MSDLAPQPTTSLTRLAVLSHAVIARHQHTDGAYPASPPFSAYQGFAWFRDGAFIADGMSRYGNVESASRFHDWCGRVLADRHDHVNELLAAAAAGESPALDRMLPTRFTLDGNDGQVPWPDFQLDGYGTWLWSVIAHSDRHVLDPARWSRGIDVAVDYLAAFWDRPCYDWWEEQVEHRHVSTLGPIAAGLGAVAASGVLTLERAGRARQAARDIRVRVLTEGVHDGHLTKWLGAAEVDASLLACIVPFGLIAVDDPIAARTIHVVRRDLVFGHGTHRYAADVFYGGGQWPLLTCLLGWNLLAAGDIEGARACLAWAADQADPSGLLPEQTAYHLLAPEHRQEWIDRWGPVATPLLWSHAMYLTLAVELGLHGQRPS